MWDIFTYGLLGGLTTLVNVGVFAISTHGGMSWWLANFIAWVLSVLFAFTTNKFWVFDSHTESVKAFWWEFVKFVFARVMSLGMDYVLMYMFIDLLGVNQALAKILTQFFIVVVNYALSKFVIFKDKQVDK